VSDRPPTPPAPALPSIPFAGATDPCSRHGCSACCHDIEMILTDADLARLRAARPDEDFWFLADDEYLQLRTRDGPPAAGGEGRPCWFLEPTGRCGVWADRPEGCRLYPAFYDETIREAALDLDYCPHTEDFRLPRAVHDAVRRLGQRLQAERDHRTRRAGTEGQAGGPPPRGT